ncbi:MAG: hypothetical protein LBS95_02740 [Mycoplasmataceae bacterium]|nr:hypothetical protein [Mycoplasmataceae bacterium]
MQNNNLIISVLYILFSLCFPCFIFFYSIGIRKNDKKKWLITEWRKINYDEKIKQLKFNINKEEITKIINFKNKAHPSSIHDRYIKFTNEINHVNKKTLISLLSEIILFNENDIRFFNKNYNKLEYKTTLYLLSRLKEKNEKN